MNVSPGQIWVDVNGNEFQIIDVNLVKDQTWVYYVNVKSSQEFSCYKESFLGRFFPFQNKG